MLCIVPVPASQWVLKRWWLFLRLGLLFLVGGQNAKVGEAAAGARQFGWSGLLDHRAGQLPWFLEMKAWFGNTAASYSHRSCLYTGLCLTFHVGYFCFPGMLGRGKGMKPSSRPTCFITLHLSWHANDSAAKEARFSEQEIAFIVPQCRHEGQGSRKTREAVEGSSLLSPM